MPPWGIPQRFTRSTLNPRRLSGRIGDVATKLLNPVAPVDLVWKRHSSHRQIDLPLHLADYPVDEPATLVVHNSAHDESSFETHLAFESHSLDATETDR